VSAATRALALVSVSAVACLGCSGGGGGGGASGTSVAAATSAAPIVPSPPASNVSPDAALATALAAASVAPVPQPAQESPELIALGQALFFDKILSGNRNISCASCHNMASALGDDLPCSMGEGATGTGAARQQNGGLLIARNAPPLFDLGVDGVDTLFRDSRVDRDPTTGELSTPELLLDGPSPGRPYITAQLTSALAAQAMFPVTTAEEMRGQPGSNELANAVTNEDVWSLLMARLVGTSDGTVGGIAAYRALFQAAYPTVASYDDLNFGHAARAIAAFERSAFTGLDSPFDAYLGGDLTALTDGQKRGALLFFGKANCASCHSGPLLTDMGVHALAVPQVGPGKFTAFEDLGRSNVTNAVSDNYKFRTPPLRNVAVTGPWMHDGAYTTLEAAVRHVLDPAKGITTYDPTQLPSLFQPLVDTDANRIAARIAAIDPLLVPIALADAEVADLLDFLGSLTESTPGTIPGLVPASVPSGLPVPD
jgi:cytochrome c peroxidase